MNETQQLKILAEVEGKRFTDSTEKVKERPFAKGSRDFKFHKELPKIMVLIALSSHCPYHKHLEVIKVKVNKLWCTCLTKYKLGISCPLYTRVAPHATQV